MAPINATFNSTLTAHTLKKSGNKTPTIQIEGEEGGEEGRKLGENEVVETDSNESNENEAKVGKLFLKGRKNSERKSSSSSETVWRSLSDINLKTPQQTNNNLSDFSPSNLSPNFSPFHTPRLSSSPHSNDMSATALTPGGEIPPNNYAEVNDNFVPEIDTNVLKRQLNLLSIRRNFPKRSNFYFFNGKKSNLDLSQNSSTGQK